MGIPENILRNAERADELLGEMRQERNLHGVQPEGYVKSLKIAPTIKDLRDRLNEAIKIAGENATWNGFDDYAVYIYPENGGKFLSISPEE